MGAALDRFVRSALEISEGWPCLLQADVTAKNQAAIILARRQSFIEQGLATETLEDELKWLQEEIPTFPFGSLPDVTQDDIDRASCSRHGIGPRTESRLAVIEAGGVHEYMRQYREARVELKGDPNASVLVPQLDTVLEKLKILLEAVRTAANSGEECVPVEATEALGSAVEKMWPVLNEPAPAIASSVPPVSRLSQSRRTAGGVSRPALAEAAVIAWFMARPTSEPTAKQIADSVGNGLDAATVRNAPAWKLHQRGKKGAAADAGDGAEIGDVDQNLEEMVGTQSRGRDRTRLRHG